MSSPESKFTFPSPIGGAPSHQDFAPSVLFSVLYGLLFPIMIYRLVRSSSRTFVLIKTKYFVIERTVILALRAAMSPYGRLPAVKLLINYTQTTLNVGHVALAANLVLLLRSLLVQATANPARSSSIETHDPGSISMVSLKPSDVRVEIVEVTAAWSVHRQKERFWYRRITGFILLGCLTAFLLGVISGFIYWNATIDEGQAQLEQRLRYTAACVTLLLLLVIQGLAIYGAVMVQNIIKSSAWLVAGLATLLNVVTIYHFIAMRQQTEGSTTHALALHNVKPLSEGSDAAFYICQIAPEWIVSSILISIDVKKAFRTGKWGDAWLNNKAPVHNSPEEVNSAVV
ncbi:hypothetical protein K474DRAFT_1671445 [Panus rudis PR-1116 ss-1]|nr:hypothetical protein K474DRAFT_1671445 [Panus rudis PR-1116 ss-1]